MGRKFLLLHQLRLDIRLKVLAFFGLESSVFYEIFCILSIAVRIKGTEKVVSRQIVSYLCIGRIGQPYLKALRLQLIEQ